MTMAATGLPIATNLPAAAPQASSTSPGDVAPADFLLMLGQLLGGAVPAQAAAAGSAKAATATTDSDTEISEATDDAAALIGVPFTPPTPWTNLQPADAASDAGDALKSLDLMPLGTASKSEASDAKLAPALLEAMGKDADALTAATNPGVQSPQSVDNQHASRVALGGDVPRGLHNPVGSSAWADELGTRLALMADRGQHTASLRLSPEHLGPLEVRISVRDDQASVWFGASHADTRAALEQALPRLRELFASQGLSLADAGVFREPPRDQPRLAPSLSSSTEAGSTESEAIARVGPIRLGLVDAYA